MMECPFCGSGSADEREMVNDMIKRRDAEIALLKAELEKVKDDRWCLRGDRMENCADILAIQRMLDEMRTIPEGGWFTLMKEAEKERDALKVGIMLLFEWDEDTPYYITENNITQAIPKRIERRIKRLIGYSNNSPIKQDIKSE